MLIKDHGRIFELKAPKNLNFVYVRGKGISIFSGKKFKIGDMVMSLKGRAININFSIPSPEAIQINDEYFLDGRDYVAEDFLSHSCSPNTKLDIEKRQVIAIKNISNNEELNYNYLTTEWDMKQWGTDFKCICKSKKCYGHIKGFKYLNQKEKIALMPLLTSFLLGKIDQIGINKH